MSCTCQYGQHCGNCWCCPDLDTPTRPIRPDNGDDDE